MEYCTGQNATPGDWLQYSTWFIQCRRNFHSITASLKYWVVFQNLTDDQIDDVIVAYEPTNITDSTETKIAISDMIGDIYFVCAAEVFAQVSLVLVTSNNRSFTCPIICADTIHILFTDTSAMLDTKKLIHSLGSHICW